MEDMIWQDINMPGAHYIVQIDVYAVLRPMFDAISGEK